MLKITENCLKKTSKVKDYVFKLTDEESVFMETKSVKMTKSYEKDLINDGYIIDIHDIDNDKYPMVTQILG